MLRIVRNFRDGMGDRVRTDSTHSECNDFTRGLRQGCVLSPLLCNVFFAAALRVVLFNINSTLQPRRSHRKGFGTTQ